MKNLSIRCGQKPGEGTASLTPKPPLTAIPSAAEITARLQPQGIGPDQPTRDVSGGARPPIVSMSSTGYFLIELVATRTRLRFTGNRTKARVPKRLPGKGYFYFALTASMA